MSCGTAFEFVEVERGISVLDLRCLSHSQRLKLTFDVPVRHPATDVFVRRQASHPRHDDLPSREQIRRRYGTKLQRTSLRHLAQAAEEHGPDAAVLDLGCGGGGNRHALADLGLRRVTAIDLWSPAADYLADAHRLPFATGVFDVVLGTATVEHFANPFLAFREIARVLKPGGVLVATASFWESWHASSFFHTTPGGLYTLCLDADLQLTDLWSGWGFVASVGAHALGLARYKPSLYRAQAAFDTALRLLRGDAAAGAHRLRTSGSFGIRAQKPVASEAVPTARLRDESR